MALAAWEVVCSGSARILAQPVTVEEMAASVRMSASSFHQRFKAGDHDSPSIPEGAPAAMEARRLMLFQDMDANDACHRVRYLSPSQFSRRSRSFLRECRAGISRGCARRGFAVRDRDR